jgi:hypothetical protein
VSDTPALRLDLIPLAIGIALVAVGTSVAVVVLRKADRADGETDLMTTFRLALAIAIALIGVAFFFRGLFE